jgi:hypothetical protein
MQESRATEETTPQRRVVVELATRQLRDVPGMTQADRLTELSQAVQEAKEGFFAEVEPIQNELGADLQIVDLPTSFAALEVVTTDPGVALIEKLDSVVRVSDSPTLRPAHDFDQRSAGQANTRSR